MFHKSICRFLSNFSTHGARSSRILAQVNHGALSAKDQGDPFTQPSSYRNKKNLTAMVRTRRKIRNLSNRQGRNLESSRDLRTNLLNQASGFKTSENELFSNSTIRDNMTGSEKKLVGNYIDRHVMESVQRDEKRREHRESKFLEPYTSSDHSKQWNNIIHEGDEQHRMETYRRRLIEEDGLYPQFRLEAYLKSDEGCFSSWVQSLPHNIKDRVKYGDLGLTIEDEISRAKLAVMPPDKRQKEYERLRCAKEYKEASTIRISPAELQKLRSGKRLFHYLQRRRQRRATAIRRLALRRPEQFDAWPTEMIDYSQRLALIAKYVEEGIDTKGNWPLPPDEIMKVRQRRQEGHGDFIESSTSSLGDNSINKRFSSPSAIATSLEILDSKLKPFRRLSKKAYANRVNAVVHGDQDEYGRKYKKIKHTITKKHSSIESTTEYEVEKQLRNSPQVFKKGTIRRDDMHWAKDEAHQAKGLPSLHYGL